MINACCHSDKLNSKENNHDKKSHPKICNPAKKLTKSKVQRKTLKWNKIPSSQKHTIKYFVESKPCNTYPSIIVSENRKVEISDAKIKENNKCRRLNQTKLKTCSSIILSGKRKGGECGAKIKGNTEFCLRHAHKTTTKRCPFTILYGIRKGDTCGAKIKGNNNFCGHHINIVMCDAVLKTGYRKGEICGRKVKNLDYSHCGYHRRHTNKNVQVMTDNGNSANNLKNKDFIENKDFVEDKESA
jgi:hypothetical protein